MKAGLIPHIPDEPLVMIRQCYLRICDNDACEAALLNHLEYCLMWKRRTQGQAEKHNQAAIAAGERPAQDTEDWWYATFDELGENLLNCWGRSKVIAALTSLIERGYVERRRNPKYKMDRTWQYRLHIGNVKDGLKKAGYSIAVSTDASVENNQSENQSMDASPETANASSENNQSSVENNRSSVENNQSSAESNRTIPEIPSRDSDSEIPSTETTSVAPIGAEVVFDGSFENEDSALPESPWSSEGIQNIAACFLSPLPLMRKEQRAEAEANWQMAAERILNHSTWVCHDDEERPQLFTGLLQFVTDPTSPCKYTQWWLANIGDLAKLRLWHIADNLYRLYQDYMRSDWQPQGDQAEAITEEPTVSGLDQEAQPGPATPPVIDTEPEPTVTPEPVVTPAAESLPALTLDEMKHFIALIRAERSVYSVQRYTCPGGYYLEASVRIERIHRIDSQASFDAFMESTKPRSWRDVLKKVS